MQSRLEVKIPAGALGQGEPPGSRPLPQPPHTVAISPGLFLLKNASRGRSGRRRGSCRSGSRGLHRGEDPPAVAGMKSVIFLELVGNLISVYNLTPT